MYIHRFLDFLATDLPDALMAADDYGQIDYAGAGRAVDLLADMLRQSGLHPGDRFAVLSENRFEVILLVFAASRTGTVATILQPVMPAAELAAIVRDSQARMLWHSDSLKDVARGVAADVGLPRPLPFPERDRMKGGTVQPADETPSDAVVQLYTSGTTGRPKGVVMGHQTFSTSPLLYSQVLIKKPGPGTVQLVATPLSHIGGLGSAMWPCLTGSAAVLRQKFDPLGFLNDLVDWKIDGLFVVPTMLQMLIEAHENFDRADQIDVSQIAYGAAPMSVDLLDRATRTFGCGFLQLYGLSESSIVTALTPEDHRKAASGQAHILRSVGRSLPTTRIAIRDRDGNTLAPDEVGEIVAEAPSAMLEYWRLPDETSEVMRDGWVHTGDIGVIDKDGYVYLRDRKKDVVISGGKNIYPAEIENALHAHPKIDEIAVVGVPDEKFGEVPLAAIVLKHGETLDIEEVDAFCRPRLAGYKIPRLIRLMPELPHNATGKVLKPRLRELLGAAQTFPNDNKEDQHDKS